MTRKVIMTVWRDALLLLALGFLASCAGIQPQQDAADARGEHRQAVLSQSSWSMSGRLAVRDARQGGTGALRWDHEPAMDVLEFRAGLGAGAWRLEVPREGLAVMQTGGGERFTGSNVEQLLEQHLGWTLPVGKFRYWVRGAAGPGETDQDSFSYDTGGRLRRLSQDGWTVEFDNYTGTPALPGRIVAESGEYSVKLLVQGWRT